MFVHEAEEIEDIALATSDFGDNVVTPEDSPKNYTDEAENDEKRNSSNNTASFARFFLDLGGGFGFLVFGGCGSRR